jgi:GntR family transcriptional regulator/MocR family aminotransferase
MGQFASNGCASRDEVAYPEPVFAFADDPSIPLFVRVAQAIRADVSRGRFRRGDVLPGARTLAEALGIHRNTVAAAYAELEAQGVLDVRQGARPRVAEEFPPSRGFGVAPRTEIPARAAFDLGGPTPPPWRPPPRAPIELFGGVPDSRLFPRELLVRTYRRVAARAPRATWDYTDEPRGHPALREAIARRVGRARGLAATADDVVVTRGSQMALALVAEMLIAPGDVVAVEDPGYVPAWAAFRQRGATLHPLPVDARGASVDALASLCAKTRVRAVYVTPHHQYPTTASLTPARRQALLALARAHRFAIVEDDYDHEFHYEGRPLLPLASADRHGSVIYVGTLSKILAPGLRTGFVVAPSPVTARLAALRIALDRQGDPILEATLAELLDEGEIDRHVRKTTRAYRARRDAFVDALERAFADALSFTVPSGGMALWARARVDVDRWAGAALERGVLFQPGRLFRLARGESSHARFGFAKCTEGELRNAVAILRRTHDARAAARSQRR